MPPRLSPAQIAARARGAGIDPDAALRVAGAEGLSGGIGDGGHAFGPFQLNDAGGVLTGRFPGKTVQQKQQWAWSPQGVDYALQRIAPVARGLHGADAVRAIVTKFERPADPQGEIARALAGPGWTGATGGAVPVAQPPSAPLAATLAAPQPQPQPDRRAELFQALGGAQGGDYSGFYAMLANVLRERQALMAQPGQRAAAPAMPQMPRAAAAPPAPRPSTTPAYKPGGRTLGYLEKFASPYGLTVTSTTGGHHAAHSYHYQGRAVDFGGDPAKMAQLAKQALAHPGQFVEEIYTGPGNTGFSILGGKVVPNSQLGKALYDEHTNHVHLAR